MPKSAKTTPTKHPVEQPRSPVDSGDGDEDSKKPSAIAEFKQRSQQTMQEVSDYTKISQETIMAELKTEFKTHFDKSKFVPNKPFLKKVESLMNTKAEITLETLTELALHSLIDERFHDIAIAKELGISIIELTKLINDKNPNFLMPSNKFFDDSEKWKTVETVDDLMAKIKPKKEKDSKHNKASSSSSNSSEDDSSHQVAILGLLQLSLIHI